MKELPGKSIQCEYCESLTQRNFFCLQYSIVFTYNPNVLTRPYQHLTTKALIEPYHITCVSLDISVLIVRFGNRARACRVQAIRNELTTLQQKFLGYLSNCPDNNALDNRLSLSASVAINKQISEVILTIVSHCQTAFFFYIGTEKRGSGEQPMYTIFVL